MNLILRCIQKLSNKYGNTTSDRDLHNLFDAVFVSKEMPLQPKYGFVRVGDKTFGCKGHFSLIRSIWLITSRGQKIFDALSEIDVVANGDVHSQIFPVVNDLVQQMVVILPPAFTELLDFCDAQ